MPRLNLPEDSAPRVEVRIRQSSSRHSGGAWKVAYADFVTAMMALFMVLWISAQDKKILIATSRYFQNPFKAELQGTTGVLPYDTNKIAKDQGNDESSGNSTNKAHTIEKEKLSRTVSV